MLPRKPTSTRDLQDQTVRALENAVKKITRGRTLDDVTKPKPKSPKR